MKKAGTSKNTGDFAVIADGGKQYIVRVGDTVTLETRKVPLEKGASVTFENVLLSTSGDKINLGMPHVSGASVSGTVESVGRGDKVTVVRYKQKSRYFKKNGHRQPEMKVKITSI